MDFFKSVFSEDPEPSSDDDEEHKSQDPPQESTSNESTFHDTDPNNPTTESPTAAGSTWNFGGLIKTLTPVIQTYRRDLEEFGSGLKKETSIIREVASRAVKELPSSIEVGASVAQGSIESVGHVIDEFGSSVWRGTSEIISNSKEALLDLDSQSDSDGRSFNSNSNSNSNTKHYSRFEMQIQAIQSDVNTYSEQPDDLDDYGKWKAGFLLEEKAEEIENLLEENAVVEEIYNKIVPGVVDGDAFWSRYFYRVYKLKQAEDARANLVKRAISGAEEELSWDVDDDDSNGYEMKNESLEINEEKIEFAEPDNEKSSSVGDVNNETKENVQNPVDVVESVQGEVSNENVSDKEGKSSELGREELVVKESDDKSLPAGKTEHGESSSSSKRSEVPVVVSQSSGPEEEDIEWDEIEDIDSHDDKKVAASGSPNKTDLRKRLSVPEDEEDLSWDIEDDDEPVKH